ncbi:MAG: ParA family protein [Clostridiales bacterium]|nr:ParA family protein [Clostridiales bacterium]
MSNVLALLSGKGGSGKTTLALSMSSILSSCDIKVLLIDCDLNTNGATYFYENKLSEFNGKILSFYDILFNSSNSSFAFYDEKQVVKINKFMDFIPSIIQVTKKNTASYSYKKEDFYSFLPKISGYFSNYDVVILDCQAGYSDILKLILKIVDINLVVMEADAISSASIRSLYLKIGDLINENKIYQVFNKATAEEYEIYSKISGGTVFTNIETVIFDWKIRKSFSVAEIPDMENTSANYGKQIWNICKILFRKESLQNRLNKYEIILKIHKYSEEDKLLAEKLKSFKEENKIYQRDKIVKNILAPITSSLSLLSLALTFYYIVINKTFSEYATVENIGIIIAALALTIIINSALAIGIILYKESKNSHNNKEADAFMCSKKRSEVLKKLNEAKKEYEKFITSDAAPNEKSEIKKNQYGPPDNK